MASTTKSLRTSGVVPISDLAAELGRDLHTFQRWLLRHDICVDRRQDAVAVLTDAEAAKARFLNSHGVLLERAAR